MSYYTKPTVPANLDILKINTDVHKSSGIMIKASSNKSCLVIIQAGSIDEMLRDKKVRNSILWR